jgi:ketosteroid isomerase-like protein
MLVEREPDQQRHRIVRDQLVGLVRASEAEAVGHAEILAGDTWWMSSNAELVRAWHAAASDGRVEDLLALTHPDFEMTEASALPGATRVEGREAMRRYCHGFRKIWAEGEWREEELVELPPDRILFDATLRLRGLRSSIWVEHRWAYLLVIRDGLVLRNDGFETKEEALAAAR